MHVKSCRTEIGSDAGRFRCHSDLVTKCTHGARGGSIKLTREGSSGTAYLKFGFEVEKVELTNVLEEHQLDLTLEGDSLALELAAFEIKTIKFKLT